MLYLQHQIYGKDESKKENLIKSYIEWKEKKTKEKKSPEFLFNVAELCQNDSIKAVVTYNYDEFLSILINSNSIRKAEDVFHFQQQKSVAHDKLLIYHVHGFIPGPQSIIKQNPENIVLAYDEYFQNMLEPFSWQTTTQLHFLMNYTCLFLGTSLNDINMLRILSYAKKYSRASNHYVIFKEENAKNNETISSALNLIHSSVLEEVGIQKIIAGDEYYHIYEMVKKINDIN
ncbi:unnamed protein product [marine sediment metagenome]|uniref:Uncharacterized protein n=1 Tax=marine sediment metagenome TaxID=412755 RepID=X0WKS7_9ZZZZ